MRAQQTTPDSFVAPEPEYARLTLEGMAPLGDCYAPFEEQTINVFGGLPGEQVVARIVRFRRRRRKFVSAIVERVLSPSPHRVAPPMPALRAVQRLPVAARQLRTPAHAQA